MLARGNPGIYFDIRSLITYQRVIYKFVGS